MLNENASKLLDIAIEHNRLKNDAALSRLLQVAPPVLSKIRHSRLPVGHSMILNLIELAGIPLETIRQYVPRKAIGHEAT